jgi:hypothetical protein
MAWTYDNDKPVSGSEGRQPRECEFLDDFVGSERVDK